VEDSIQQSEVKAATLATAAVLAQAAADTARTLAAETAKSLATTTALVASVANDVRDLMNLMQGQYKQAGLVQRVVELEGKMVNTKYAIAVGIMSGILFIGDIAVRWFIKS
jgi:hypothetical protein